MSSFRLSSIAALMVAGFALPLLSQAGPGALDRSFNPGKGADTQVNAVLLQPDGKILIGGIIDNFDGLPRSGLARLHSNGSIDRNFNPRFTDPYGSFVRCIALQSDGNILVAGAFSTVNGISRKLVARLRPDGTLDPTFNPTFVLNHPSGIPMEPSIRSLAILPSGKILLGGSFTSVNGITRTCLTRLHADGTVDESFNVRSWPPTSPINSIALQDDGKVLVTSINIPFQRFARLQADGSLDEAFAPTLNNEFSTPIVRCFLQRPDGQILIGGSFTSVDGMVRVGIARLNPDGRLDTGFQPGQGIGMTHPPFPDTVYALANQADGKVIIAGGFRSFDRTERSCIARIHPDGSVDADFAAGLEVSNSGGATPSIRAIAIQEDGRVLVGGHFTFLEGVERRHIGRLEGDRPPLQIHRTPAGVLLAWPSFAQLNYILESSPSASSESIWTEEIGASTTIGNQQVIQMEANDSLKVFRLRKK